MSHPTPFDGCFFPTLAYHAFQAEFFGKAAHAVLSLEKATDPGYGTVGWNQLPRRYGASVQ